MTLLPTKFGPYGGQFVPETLMPALIELEEAFVSARQDAEFIREFDRLMASFVGRPTPLTYAKRHSRMWFRTRWRPRTDVPICSTSGAS